MNAVTRSGSNKLHGTLFEFVRNEKFNARNFFANSIPPFKRNQFGGTVGGPIRRDKTFFFGSFQRTAERSTPGVLNPTVLTAQERKGDWSDAGLKTPLKDPLGGNFPNNIIPAQPPEPAVRRSSWTPSCRCPTGRNQYSFASQQKIDDYQGVSKDRPHAAREQPPLRASALQHQRQLPGRPTTSRCPASWR